MFCPNQEMFNMHIKNLSQLVHCNDFIDHLLSQQKLTENFDFLPCLIFPFSAICDSKINPTGACTLSYSDDRILKRDGSVARISGGRCSSPEKCTNCNDGFYGDGPYCKSMYLYIQEIPKLILNRKFLIVLFIYRHCNKYCNQWLAID